MTSRFEIILAPEKKKSYYPKEAIRLLRNALGIISGKTIVDLAAGSGMLTECFLNASVNLIAVEPKEQTRQIYSALFPDILLLNGKAESLPLDDNSIDAILVGSAFHKFDAVKSLTEIARVLKPKGGLGLIWNGLDDNIDWVKQIYVTKAKFDGNSRNLHNIEWKKAFEHLPRLFFPLQHRTFPFSYLEKPQKIIESMLSCSLIAPIPEEKKRTLYQEICQILNVSIADTHEIDLLTPYRTEVYWTYKL